MSVLCTQTQEFLAQAGLPAVDDKPELAAHFAGCEECRAVWSALQTVDATFAAMEPVDVPDALLQQTLAAIESEKTVAEAHSLPPAVPAPAHTPMPLPVRPAKLPWVVRYHQVVAAAAAVLFLILVGGVGSLFLVTGSKGDSEPASVEESARWSDEQDSVTEESVTDDLVANNLGPTNSAQSSIDGRMGDRWSTPSGSPAQGQTARAPRDASGTGQVGGSGGGDYSGGTIDAPTPPPSVAARPTPATAEPRLNRNLEPMSDSLARIRIRETSGEEDPNEPYRPQETPQIQGAYDRNSQDTDSSSDSFSGLRDSGGQAEGRRSRRSRDEASNRDSGYGRVAGVGSIDTGGAYQPRAPIEEAEPSPEPEEAPVGSFGWQHNQPDQTETDSNGRGENRDWAASTAAPEITDGHYRVDVIEEDEEVYEGELSELEQQVDELGEDVFRRRARLEFDGLDDGERSRHPHYAYDMGDDADGDDDGRVALSDSREEQQNARRGAQVQRPGYFDQGIAIDNTTSDIPDFSLHTSTLSAGDSIDLATSFLPSGGELALDIEFARQFLAERSRSTDLHFQQATGYWANTYVPGDPVLRALQQRLRDDAQQQASNGFALAETARTPSQPFDSPSRSALAVYLQSDRRGVDGESRVLLQVGIQGTSRQSGRRPAMNIGVVLDLTAGVSPTNAASIRALMEELSRATDVGDRFSLTVAGPAGGTVIQPGEFGYGRVTLLANDLLSQDRSHAPGLTLEQAIREALTLVQSSDDPTATLGSSLVLLVTPGRLGSQATRVEQIAHDAAVDGIPTSVVGVGDAIDLVELDRLALAGQGNRRLLEAASSAERVVQSELTAAGRVVARAVRLRIRLAPGVQLVDVLGSHRLDEATAEQVREAEQSIDQRMSQNLGIVADRGEDEDGIQIVIPAFYADDSHVILLDLVAPGPGSLADVTVRYKDLVQLRNAIAMDTIDLTREDDHFGPLQTNVLKNLLAFELSETLRRSGALVTAGHLDAGRLEIADFASLLRGLQADLPTFSADPEIMHDLNMVSRYLAVFQSVHDGSIAPPNDLADSLLYAGYRKLLEIPSFGDE